MSYEPTTWKDGDLVTSAKLNKMEQGIAGSGGMVVVHGTIDQSNGTMVLDKTWQEIYDAAPNVILVTGDDNGKGIAYFSTISSFGATFNIIAHSLAGMQSLSFYASSANDYPVANLGESGNNNGELPPFN